MKVLLLGATGLLGHNVLLELLKRGHEVVALVREAARLQLPTDMTRYAGGLQVVEDCQSRQGGCAAYDMETLRQAAVSCNAIINCAGMTDMSRLSYADYLPVNKVLCERTLQLMHELSISTLVYVSTANTIGYGSVLQPGTEHDDMQFPFTNSWYAQSKVEAEEMLAWEAQQYPDRHIVIVNPGFMVGPYDTKPSSGKLLMAAYRHRLMATPGGGKSFVHVGDVAVATVNSLTMGRNGERYLLTGENMSLSHFYALQAEVCSYRQQLIVLPNWLVRLAGRVGDLLRQMKIRTQLSTRNVQQLLVLEYYSNEKARQELLMPQTPIAHAISDFWEWRNAHRC